MYYRFINIHSFTVSLNINWDFTKLLKLRGYIIYKRCTTLRFIHWFVVTGNTLDRLLSVETLRSKLVEIRAILLYHIIFDDSCHTKQLKVTSIQIMFSHYWFYISIMKYYICIGRAFVILFIYKSKLRLDWKKANKLFINFFMAEAESIRDRLGWYLELKYINV